MLSCPSGPLILSSSVSGTSGVLAHCPSARRNGSGPYVVLLLSGWWEKDEFGGWRRGEGLLVIGIGNGGVVIVLGVIPGEERFRSLLSGDLTSDAVCVIWIEGGGGMNSGGGELSCLDKGLVPVELSFLSVDSCGVWVAIDVVKEFVGRWGGWTIVGERGHVVVSSRERVFILLDCSLNSTSKSGVWRSSSGTHSSWEGE